VLADEQSGSSRTNVLQKVNDYWDTPASELLLAGSMDKALSDRELLEKL